MQNQEKIKNPSEFENNKKVKKKFDFELQNGYFRYKTP